MQDVNNGHAAQDKNEKSVRLLEHNPLLRQPALAVLRIAQEQPTMLRQSIEAAATQALIGQNLFQSIPVLVDVLIRNGALNETVLVDGEPYGHGFQALQSDGAIDAEARVERLITITETGIELLASYASQNQLTELLEREPSLRNIYLNILQSCKEKAGCTRFELEELVDALNSEDAKVGDSHAKRHPQYFLDALETAGGIIWGQAWRVTEAGEAVISQQT
ncbi:MAG: hypothetical protein LBS98_08225 [Coriobacteriales bacterium]|jgi:hypothetical protein|nr:hypothetical protein [Coriobacteriales bacterium]